MAKTQGAYLPYGVYTSYYSAPRSNVGASPVGMYLLGYVNNMLYGSYGSALTSRAFYNVGGYYPYVK
jgi:hypothetical protein